jgi:hypothetical protein
MRTLRDANLAALALLCVVSVPIAAVADVEFRARKMTREDVPLGKGQCDIRVRIDGEAEVSLRGDLVHLRTISGRDGRDDGSECNELLPARPVEEFNFEVRDSRGEIQLLSEPLARTGFRAVVRIRDTEGGEGRYHFRLTWRMDGGGPGFVRPGNQGRPGGGRGPYDAPRGRMLTAGQAIDACRGAVQDAVSRQYGYNSVDISNGRGDERQGRNNWIIGDATGRRGGAIEYFIFSCQVDFNSGAVLAVDVRRR